MKRTTLLILAVLLSLTFLFVACDGNKNPQSLDSSTEAASEPETETEAMNMPDTEETSEPDTEATSEPETEGTSEPETEGTSEPETEGASEPETEDTSEPETEDTSEPETEDTSELETQPHEHVFGEWAAVKDATCTAQGEQQRVCDCGEVETQITEIIEHSWECHVCTVCAYSECLEFELLENGTYSVHVKDIAKLPGEVELPSAYLEQPVTMIAANAFAKCSDLTSITIPESIVSIGDCAFNGCYGLTEIIVPNSVTSIGFRAFDGCNNLVSMTIPFVGETKYGTENQFLGYIFGATSHANNRLRVPASLQTVVVTGESTIANGAFYRCKTLSHIVIGDGVTIIGGQAFRECSQLTSVVIGNSVTSIGQAAFYDCNRLTEIKIPDSVTSIGASAFDGCTNLMSVEMGSGVISIGGSAFMYCSKLSAVYISNLEAWCRITFNSIYSNPLYYSDNVYLNGELLTELIIPNSTTIISDYAFTNCVNLTSIVIPDGVTSIGESAFAGCSGITDIKVPDSVMTIGFGAFNDCNSLVSMTLPFVGASRDGSSNANLEYLFDTKFVTVFDEAIPASLRTLVITDTNIIGRNAFINCSGLTSIVLPDSVTRIDENAFKNCTELTSINLPHHLKVIGGSAFDGCTNLTGITIPHGVAVIGGSAFSDCISLTSIVIPDSVISIGWYTFSGCSGLTSIEISNGLTSIARGAFVGCIGLKSVVIPDSVTSIGEIAFAGCTSLTSVVIHSNLTDINYSAFDDCDILVDVYYAGTKEEWETLDPWARSCFEDATIHYNWNGSDSEIDPEPDVPNENVSISLEYILNADKTGYIVTGIGTYINTELEIPAMHEGLPVVEICEYAFSSCKHLTSVTIPGTITRIGDGAFYASGIDRIFYAGTADEWLLIDIGDNISYPFNAAPYYFSATQPSSVGDYWYYNEDGEKRVWNVSDTSFRAEYYSESFVNIFADAESSFATTFYNELEYDTAFQAGLAAWEILHVVADTTLTDGVWQISKKDLYKLVIFDLLCGEANSQETLINAFESSTWAYMDDLTKDIFGNEMTRDALKTVAPKLNYSTDLLKYNIIGLQYIFETSSNMYEALRTCATYLVLADMDESFQYVLLQIANDPSNPWELREAAFEYAAISQMSVGLILANFTIEYKTADFRAMFSIFTDLLWDKLIETTFPDFAIVQSVAKGLLFLADLGFNVDDIYQAYYMLEVDTHLEASLRTIVQDPAQDYYLVSNRPKAETYVYAVDMYKTSVLLGYEYSNCLLNEYSKNLNDEEEAECTALMNKISAMQQEKQNLYQDYDAKSWLAFAEYYS